MAKNKLSALAKRTVISCNIRENKFLIFENGLELNSFDFSKPVLDATDFEREFTLLFSKVQLNKKYPILFVAPDEFLFHTYVSYQTKQSDAEEKALRKKFKKKDDYIFDLLYSDRNGTNIVSYYEVCSKQFYSALNKVISVNGYRLQALCSNSQACVFSLMLLNPILEGKTFVHVYIKNEYTMFSLVSKNNILATTILPIGEDNFNGEEFPARLLYSSIDFSSVENNPVKPNELEINERTITDIMAFSILHLADKGSQSFPSEVFDHIVISCTSDVLRFMENCSDFKENEEYKVDFLNSFTDSEIVCKYPEFLGIAIQNRYRK